MIIHKQEVIDSINGLKANLAELEKHITTDEFAQLPIAEQGFIRAVAAIKKQYIRDIEACLSNLT